MQARSGYSDNLVNIINTLAHSINQETSSATTSSTLHMLAFAINEYEKNRIEDIQNLSTTRATMVTHAAHLYQRRYENHLHRHVYSDEAKELSKAVEFYEKSIYDDIRTINIMTAQLHASMMMKFLEENTSELQQQVDSDTSPELSSTEEAEWRPLLDDLDPEDISTEWETLPLLLEDFESEHNSHGSPINNSPASPRFFDMPRLMLKSHDSEINYVSDAENSQSDEATQSFNYTADDENDSIDSPNPLHASYYRF